VTVSVYWATDDEYLLVSIILQNLLSEVDAVVSNNVLPDGLKTPIHATKFVFEDFTPKILSWRRKVQIGE